MQFHRQFAMRSSERNPRLPHGNSSPPSAPLVLNQDSSPTDGLMTKTQHIPSRKQNPGCAVKHCSCFCHATTTTTNGFWRFEFTPLSTLFRRCDRKSCTARHHRLSIWIGLTQIGIPFAALASFDMVVGEGKYSIMPSLSVQNIVKNTAPGFELLWKCSTAQIEWPKAQDAFIALYRSDSNMVYHVDRTGKGYLEVRIHQIILRALIYREETP